MTGIPPTAMGARPGDVIHVRGDNFYGRAIRRCLPGSWGNHDATLVFQEPHEWGVAEALTTGFVVTPWEQYLARVGKDKIVFLRPAGMPHAKSLGVQFWALEMAARRTKYRYRDILRIWINVFTRANIGAAPSEWSWYCTQAVAQQHYWASPASSQWDVWGRDSLPTPFTTEKRVAAGLLEVVKPMNSIYDFGCTEFLSHIKENHNVAPAVIV